MSANSSVYSTNTLQGYSTSEDVTLALLPLNLSDYNGAMSSLFYLDDVRTLKDKSNKEVFVGLVATNSYNYGMRPASRLGKGRFLKDGVVYIMCNDGGLNTYGYTIINECVDNQPCNRVYVTMTGQSAYYSATTKCGVYYQVRTTTGTLITEGEGILLHSLPSKESLTNRFYIEDVLARASHIMTLTPFIINDQGEKSYTSQTITLKEGVYSLQARKITAYNTQPTSEFVPVYMNSEAWVYMGILVRNELGIRFPVDVVMYENEQMTRPIEEGIWQVRYHSYNIHYDVPGPADGFEYQEDSLALYEGDKAVVNVDADGVPTRFVTGTWSDIDYTRYGTWTLNNVATTAEAVTGTIAVSTKPSGIVYLYYKVRMDEATTGTRSTYSSEANYTTYDPSSDMNLIPTIYVTPEQLGIAGGTFDSAIGMHYTFTVSLYVSTSNTLSNPQEMATATVTYSS